MTDPCLSETSILAFVQGAMVGPAREKAERHLAACEECRMLVSVLARSSLVDVDEAKGAPPAPAPAPGASPEEPSTLVSRTDDLPAPAPRALPVSLESSPRLSPAPSPAAPTPKKAPRIAAAVALAFFALLVLYVLKDVFGPHAP